MPAKKTVRYQLVLPIKDLNHWREGCRERGTTVAALMRLLMTQYFLQDDFVPITTGPLDEPRTLARLDPVAPVNPQERPLTVYAPDVLRKVCPTHPEVVAREGIEVCWCGCKLT